MKKDRNQRNIELIQAKDLETLLSENYRYIIQCANNFNCPAYQKDLEQVGKIGMWKAAENFDATKGIPFIKFAGVYIRNEMIYVLVNEIRTIRTNAHLQKVLGKYLEMDNPTDDELQAVFTKKQIQFIKSGTWQNLKSLDVPAFDDSTENLSETIATPEEDEPDMRLSPLLKAIEQLKPDLKDVLIKYYGLNETKKLTIKELAKKHNLSPEGIRVRIRKAEKQLKTLMKAS